MTGRYTPRAKSRRDPMADLFPYTAATGIPTYVDGGCDECDATQRTERLEHLIWQTTVMHDDWCPQLERIRTKNEART